MVLGCFFGILVFLVLCVFVILSAFGCFGDCFSGLGAVTCGMILICLLGCLV